MTWKLFFCSCKAFILRCYILDRTWPRRQDNWQVMSWKEFGRNWVPELKEQQQKVLSLIIRYLSQDSKWPPLKIKSGNLGVQTYQPVPTKTVYKMHVFADRDYVLCLCRWESRQWTRIFLLHWFLIHLLVVICIGYNVWNITVAYGWKIGGIWKETVVTHL
jgi:hypothetical protein